MTHLVNFLSPPSHFLFLIYVLYIATHDDLNILSCVQSVEISDCDQVTDVGINDGILSGKPKKTLRELNLGLLQNLTETVMYRLSYFYEHLVYLDLGGNSIAVTDDALQRIIRHMRFLKKLNLDSCCKVSF
jgi:Leucine-rich repeat (LRR) protein